MNDDSVSIERGLTDFCGGQAHLPQKRLSEAAIAWISSGERCVAADTVFSVVTGHKLLKSSDYACPLNVNDIRKCRLLIESVPEIADGFKLKMAISPAWSRILEKWGEICLVMNEESPEWRKSKGAALRLNSLIQGIVLE